jgi:ribosomal protein S18 acetylase RimI-like enzyme
VPAALTASDVAVAIERSTLEFWRTVCPHLPNVELYDEADATWFTTGIPFFPFNQVLRVSFPPEAADGAIDDLLARFAAYGVPFCWNVGAGSQPPDLAARLEARSPVRAHTMPAMALDLTQPLEQPAPPDGLAIEPVRDARSLDRWARAYTDGFGLPDGFSDVLRDAYAQLGFDGDAPFRHYLGLLAGAPVACSTMFLAGGVADLWHIGTLPEFRRRGIGAAMTLQPLYHAQALGQRLAVLYASEMGAPIYYRLGFREHARLPQYGWQLPEGSEL